MNVRFIAKLASTCLVALLLATPAAAAGDASATSAIDKAINEKYITTDFDGAEKDLIAVISDCADSCSGATVARAWMYVGLVRGAGKQDLDGAKDAFSMAKTFDPNVKLDRDLSPPEVQQAFDDAVGGTPPEPAEEVPVEEELDADQPAVESGEMICALLPPEVEINRKLPIQCTAPAGSDDVAIFYRAPHGEDWIKVPMTKVSGEVDTWQGEIGCGASGKKGTLEWYAKASAGGSAVAGTGDEDTPNRIELVAETAEVPPAYPGKSPPGRCAPTGDEGGPEQGGWGASCADDAECAAGFLCIQGGCEAADACEQDSDCATEGAYCEDNLCRRRITGGYRQMRNWVGLHASMDLTTIGGSEVCNPASADGQNFECFLNGQLYTSNEGVQVPIGSTNRSGRIDGGITPGTMRIMLSYERVLTGGKFATFGLEARAGLVFLDDHGGSKTFIPLHAEMRLKYYLGSLPFEASWFRPFISIGGGLGSTSADIQTVVDDCSFAVKDTRVDENGDRLVDAEGRVLRDDEDADVFYRGSFQNPEVPSDVDYEASTPQDLCLAYPAQPGDNPQRSQFPVANLRMGPVFVGAGLGAMFALGEHHGIVVSAEGAVLLPTFGITLRPTAGYVFGF